MNQEFSKDYTAKMLMLGAAVAISAIFAHAGGKGAGKESGAEAGGEE